MNLTLFPPVKTIFIDCKFARSSSSNDNALKPLLISEARSSIQLVRSTVSGVGIELRRGVEFVAEETKFTGKFDAPSSRPLPAVTTTVTANVTTNPDVLVPTSPPTAPPTTPVQAMISSAASSNVFVGCEFVDIDAHGDFALLQWDGKLNPFDGNDKPVRHFAIVSQRLKFVSGFAVVSF